MKTIVLVSMFLAFSFFAVSRSSADDTFGAEDFSPASAGIPEIVDGGTKINKNQDFALSDIGGQKVSLSSLMSAGKPVVLFFWTTWCPFCLKELKTLNQHNADHGDEVAILAINAGEDRRDVERVAKNYNLQMKVLLDPDMTVSNAYRVIGVPTFVLINPNGSIELVENSFPEKAINRLIEKNR